MGKGKERSLGPKIGHDLRKACLVARLNVMPSKLALKRRKKTMDHLRI